MLLKRAFVFILLFLVLSVQAASITVAEQKVDFSGFVDLFYGYDFSKPKGDARQDFFFNHNRHNELNVNLALLKASIDEEKYRANIAFQAGTYAKDNYDKDYENLHEANIGFSLNSKNNLWLDIGIFTSHLGFESALSTENYTLTRSLAAENSPYYLSGAKLTYTPSRKFELALIVCNGWQRIEKVEGNSLPSFGTQLIYTPKETLSFNWSTFIGTDDPDVTRRMIYFNNFFTEFLLNEKMSVIAGVDIGLRRKSRHSSGYDTWYVATLVTKYRIGKEFSSGFRAEYFHDSQGVIVEGNGYGFQTFGFSSNLDYMPIRDLLLRIEGRWLLSDKVVFKTEQRDNFFITLSAALKF